MSLEDIGTIEALFHMSASVVAEPTDHGSFVMCQGVPVPVVFAGKPFLVVSTTVEWALFWSHGPVCEQVGSEIFEHSPTALTGTTSWSLRNVFHVGIWVRRMH